MDDLPHLPNEPVPPSQQREKRAASEPEVAEYEVAEYNESYREPYSEHEQQTEADYESVSRLGQWQQNWQQRWETWAQPLIRLPVTLMIASLLLALGIVQLTFQLGNTAYRSLTWSKETQATQQRVRILERDVKILEDAQKNAQNPAYLEQMARCQGYVGKNESVVVAQNAPAAPGYNCVSVRLP